MRDISLILCYNKVMIVCFIGHRTVADAEQVRIYLAEIVANLIADGADTFYLVAGAILIPYVGKWLAN